MNTLYLFGDNLVVETDLVLQQNLISFLNQVFVLAQNQLSDFANNPEFSQQMALAFGEKVETAELQADWQAGDFSILSGVEIRQGSELNGANGVYAATTDRIYLSEKFLCENQGNFDALANLLLEEVGHRIDARLNQKDSDGDEGAIFSRLVRGETLSDETLQQLKVEDDAGVINLNGQSIQVEQQNFIGDNNNNTITGTSGDDLIQGLGGNDYLYGLAGYDDLYGGNDNDLLVGEAGNDYLYGEAGNDTLDGGEGDDYLDPGTGVDSIIGGAGEDWLNIDNSTDTADTIVNYTDPNNGTIIGGLNDGTTFKEIEGIELRTGSGNDIINISASTGNSYYYYDYAGDIYAGGGNDTVTTGSGSNFIYGEAGNDTLNGGEGDDYLYGGNDDDLLFGEAENDELYGEAGNDTLDGGEGDDYLHPGTGVDSIIGGVGEDYLNIDNPTDTADTIVNYTDPNNGTIIGGLNDGTTFKEIEGIELGTGSGNDIINISAATGNSYLNPGTGVDSIIGGAGEDWLNIDNSTDTADTIVNYTDPNNGTIIGGLNDGTTFKEIERIGLRTGSGNDIINISAATGNGYYATGAIYAGGGNDAITTGSGNDYLYGEAGNDTLDGGDGSDALYGGNDDDLLFGQAGNDYLYGEAGNDTLDGGEGDDYLNPGTGVDSIIGGAGEDWLTIDNSTDTADTTVNYTDLNNGTITGGLNNGTTFKEIEIISLQTGSGNDTINVSAATRNDYFSGYIRAGSGNDVITTGSGNDRLYGEAGNDTLIGGAGNNSIYGGNDDDLLLGGIGNDHLDGEAGNDTLDGGEGNDYLNPGTGVDSIIGGAGEDWLEINNSVDTDDTTVNYTDLNNGTITGGLNNGTTFKEIEIVILKTGSGNDIINVSAATRNGWGGDINAGGGNDVITAGSGNNYLYGEAGNDTLMGGAGNDDLYGGNDNDLLLGGTGNDYLHGDDDNDFLYGETGNDYLYGNTGNDTLIGVNPNSPNPGMGERDNLSGGSGADRFILGDGANIYYDDRNTSTSGGNDYATISDFNPSEDKIQLQGSASNYQLVVSGNNTNLYIDKAGSEPDELIAVFQNITGLNLTSSAFEYVAPINQVAFSSGSYSVNEDGTAQVTLIRTGSTTGQISITLTLANNTATAPADYTNTPISVTFNDGESSKIVTIPIINDSSFEPNETINLALTNPSAGVTIGTQSTAVFTIIDNDSPVPGTLAFSAANYSINEDGTPIVTVTVIRTGGSDLEVSATINLTNGTATAGEDYTSQDIVVTLADKETSKTITIPIINDTVYEPTETINLSLSNPTNGATLGTQTTAVVNIIDNDAVPGVLAFSQANYSINEDGTTVVAVTVTRTGGSDGAVSAIVSLSNGTATNPEDYTTNTISVNFANGETSKTVNIPIINDSVYEPDETINLTLTNPTNGATIGTQNTATLTIIDNDALPGTLAFNNANYNINEDGTPVVAVTVTRTGGSNGEVSATLNLSDGSATAPNDYTNTPITITFANGETSKTVTIPIINDTVYEPNETINLSLTTPTGGATLGNQTTAVLTIIDNDAIPGILSFSDTNYSFNENGTPATTVTINRSGGSDGEISATVLLSNGTAQAGSDYIFTPITVNFANGETTKTVIIPIVNNPQVEPTETLNLTLANPTGGATIGTENSAIVNILDDDVQLNFSGANYTVNEDGTAVTEIMVTRTGRTTGAVSATLSFADGTAKGCGCAANSVNNDFYNGTFAVTFADGETSKIIPVELASLGGTNAIRIRNDAKVEGDEYFTINLINPTGGATIGSQGSATVTILDDDPIPHLTVSINQNTIAENGGNNAATGTVTRDVVTNSPLVVSLTSSDTTEANVSQQIIIAAGQASATFNIDAVDDTILDGTQTLTITATPLNSDTNIPLTAGAGSGNLQVTDNESPSLTLSLDRNLVSETGVAIAILTRNTDTSTELVVTLTSSDTTEATVPQTITIPVGQSSVNFTVTGVNDGVSDGNQPVTLTASANGLMSGIKAFNVTDIDVPDLVISQFNPTIPTYTGKQSTFSYRIENQGITTATAPDKPNTTPPENDPWIDRIYLSNDNQLDSNDTLLGEFSFSGNVPPDLFYERNISYFAPRNPGQYYLIAVTDATNKINEGIGETNNTFITPLTVTPAYRAEVSTDTDIGITGSSVVLKGKALSNIDNSPIPYEFVTIKVENNGTVRELSAFTDAEGNFVRSFNPLPTEGGEYKINAYFPSNLSEDTAPEDTFKLLGMRFNTQQTSHKIIANSPFTGQVSLQNLSNIGLTGITATTESVLDGWNVQITAPSELNGSGTNQISYTITAPNESLITQDTFNIKLTSAEGVTAILPVNINVERIVPRLVASTNLLSSGMLRGDQTAVEFQLTNEGGAIAEDIQVLLPDAPWLRLASPTTINSLAPGESTKVTLLLTPDADLALTQYTGNVFLDAAGNDGDLSLPFNFRAVSEAVGEIRINAVDELFYFTEEAPKLANATVTLRDYFTNQVVRSVVTDETGTINLSNINEGYYNLEVKAENHDTFRQIIQLDAGEVETVDAFLSKQTVKYVWNVTPTEIEDKYNISIDSVFETDVPIPTVVIDPPLIDLADLDVVGEVMQVEMSITNHGLIGANDIKLNFGNHPFYKIEPLMEDIGTLGAKSSIAVPIRITRVADFDNISNNNAELVTLTDSGVDLVDCKITASLDYDYECAGKKIARALPIPILNVEGNCPPPSFEDFFPSFGNGGEPGGSVRSVPVVINTKSSSCDPCVEAINQAAQGVGVAIVGGAVGDIVGGAIGGAIGGVIGGAIGAVGGPAGVAWGVAIGAGLGEVAVSILLDIAKDTKAFSSELPDSETPASKKLKSERPGDYLFGAFLSQGGSEAGELLEKNTKKDGLQLLGKNFGNVLSISWNIWLAIKYGQTQLCDPSTKTSLSGTNSLSSSNTISPIDQAVQNLLAYEDRLATLFDAWAVFWGDRIWNAATTDPAFGDWFGEFLGKIVIGETEPSKIDDSEREILLNLPLPKPLNGSDVNRFIDRWNRSVSYWESGIFESTDVPEGQSQDFLAIDKISPVQDALAKAISDTKTEGYDDFLDGISKRNQELKQILQNNGGGVCAKVSINIDQEAVMTRSAFLGGLEIDNSNTTNLENLSVILQVKDAQGNVVNDLFGITNPTLKNITAVDGTGILTGDNPNTPQDEGIGSAEWTFIPTNLAAPQVPTQYTIGGTLSYTENGNAINVPLLSTPITVLPQAELHLDYFHQRDVFADDPFTDPIEPSVPYSLAVLVRNEGYGDAKNLRITSGQPKIIDNEKGLLIDFQIIGSHVNNEPVTPSLSVNFGDIKAGETAVADWLLKSSLQGKFIDYNATFEHINGLGNKELSLIKDVTIHELTHQVNVNHPNPDNLPDFLVNDTVDANFYPDTLYFSSGGTAPVNAIDTATIDAPATLNDLEVEVTATVDAGWSYIRLAEPSNSQFDIQKILRANGTEINLENIWTTDRTFPATGSPLYENILHFLDYNASAGTTNYTVLYTPGGPAVTDILDVTPDPRSTAVNAITVDFSTAIKADTFDYTDITLTLNGGTNLITPAVTITPLSATRYQIAGFNPLTSSDGEYNLTINASGIKDLSGKIGTTSLTETWLKTDSGNADITPPSVTDISDLLVNQRHTPVSSLDVIFSESIDLSTFNWQDITLTRDGGTNLMTNAVTISAINNTTYRINGLSNFTTAEGNYTLTVNGSGIQDLSGNPGIDTQSETWTMDTTPPNPATTITVANIPITTNQTRINTTNPTLTGELSEPGLQVFFYDKLTNQSLGQATVTGTSFSGTVQLSSPGSNELEIQVQDTAGNLTTNTVNLFADITQPAIAQFLNVPQTPTTNPVNYIDVRFSEVIDLSTFDKNDITLTRDGQPLSLPDTVTVEFISDTTYRIKGLGDLTNTPGNYRFQVNATTLQDNAGNAGDGVKAANFSIIPPPTPGVTLAQTNGNTTATEEGNSDTYTLVLKTQPTADVIITLTADNQITLNQTTFTFTPDNWNLPQTVTITAVNDTIPEGTHTSTITHSITSSDTDYNTLTLPSVNVGIQDDDAEIHGIVWNDANGNSIQDTDESTLPGWTVYLDTNNNNQLDNGETATTTDSNGNYTFTNLRPGTYTVAQIVQSGWQQTYPILNVTTTAAEIPLYTPTLEVIDTPLQTPSTSVTGTPLTATSLINLDRFQSDPRFATIQGQGYSTVIIDTGIDLNHPIFGADTNNDGIADRITYQYDFADNDTDASDKNGHGSHIASIAAQIAPEANLIVLKVFKDNGSGYFSDLEKALQWVNQNATSYNIASVNLSLGDSQNWTTPTSRYGIGDELAAIASQNILIAAAAGNSFYQYNSNPGVAYPAADPNVISVGAVWAANLGDTKTFSSGATDYTTGSDRIASFSQRHSTLLDIFAPGILIEGANATGGTQTLGGTSQATAYISSIALLAQQIAQAQLGRKLTLAEFDHLLDTTSNLIIDGDDENDNVNNTGLTFPRINALALAEGILTLNSPPSDTPSLPPDTNTTDTPLVVPSDTLTLTHTVTLAAGQMATGIDFGNQPLNQAPILTLNQGLNLNEAATAAISSNQLQVTDVDNTATQLTYTLTELPAQGTLRLNETVLQVNDSFTQADIDTNKITYQHNGSETTNDGFYFTVSDGAGGTIDSTAFNITVNPVNDPATITGTATAAITEDASDPNLTATGSLTVTDMDIGENQFNTTVTAAVGNLGSLTITETGTFNYSVANSAIQYLRAGETKTETFTVTSFDGTASQEILITLNGINDSAVISGTTTATVTEDSDNPNLTATGNLTIIDLDTGEGEFNTTVTAASDTLGNLTLTETGVFNYSVANSAVQYLSAGQTKDETFTITSLDGTTQDITITIIGVNDTPTATDDDYTTTENTALTSNVFSNDRDIDSNDILTVTKVNGITKGIGKPIPLFSGALLTLNADGTYTYNPNGQFEYLGQNQTDIDGFAYTLSDGKGGISHATVAITITGINNVALISGTATASILEDANHPTLTATGNLAIADVDTGEDQFNTTVVSALSNLGNLTITETGSFTYTVENSAVQYLGEGQTQTEQFTVTSFDGTASQDITVTITGVNDPAIIAGIATASLTEDENSPNLTATGNLTITDADNQEAQFNTTVVSQLENLGNLNLTDAGVFTYTVDNSAVQYLGEGQTKIERFTVTSLDGTASQDITITITGVNDNPIAIDDSETTDENTSISSQVLSNDSDADMDDPLTVSAVNGNPSQVGSPISLASGALLTLNPDGTYTYNPNHKFEFLGSGETATDSFTYTISDGNGGTSNAITTVTITGVNDTPIAVKDRTTTAQNTAVTLLTSMLLGNDRDIDTPKTDLMITGISGETNGTAVLDDNNTPNNTADDLIIFTPDPGFSGKASFNYTLSDGSLASTADVTVMVGQMIDGTTDDDSLIGTAGNDVINGWEGEDEIDGSFGDDILNGGTGDDLLNGGLGRDIFVLAMDSGVDTITDFSLGQGDKFGLTGGLMFDQLMFSGEEILMGNQTLALVSGFDTTRLTAANFVSI